MSELDNAPTPLVLEARGLAKTFSEGGLLVEVLRGVDLKVRRGEIISIIGSSGSGKSTLLHLLGGLDTPSAGEVWLEGSKLASLSETERCQLRNKSLGFVYQFHHLLPEFTALENAAMPLLLRKIKRREAYEVASSILNRLGLEKRLQHLPGELSGGERQRTSIARALVAKPSCILADEPTGNLDPGLAAQTFELLLELNRECGASLIIVTHDQVLANQADRVLTLKCGILNTSDFVI